MPLRDQKRNPILEVILAAARLPFFLLASAAGALLALLRSLQKALGYTGQLDDHSRIDTSQWTLELLKRIEWRRFEELCAAYFEALGFRAQAASNGESLDLRLIPEGSQTAAIVVHCKAWNAQSVGIKPLRALRDAMAAGNFREGVFVTSGKFTHEARAFANREKIRLIDGADFLAKIAALAPEKALALLKFATQGEFLTPTCPSCAIKMVSSSSTRDGRKYWACPNYPRCKQTFFGASHGPA